jgi:hypothetical protein
MDAPLFVQADPPPTAHGTQHHGKAKVFAEHCRANPNVWFQYRPGYDNNAGVSHYLRRRHGLEVTARRRQPGVPTFDIYARFVPEDAA